MLERLGIPLSDAPLVGWDSLLVFARHIARDASSSTFRALFPELADFASPLRQSAILADIYDAIWDFSWNLACARLPKGQPMPKRPARYPRPGAKDDVLRIGKDAIPIKDFEEWYYGGE